MSTDPQHEPAPDEIEDMPAVDLDDIPAEPDPDEVPEQEVPQ